MTQRVSSGHEVTVMSKEWLERMEKDQTGYRSGMIKLLPEGWLVPGIFLQYEKRIYNFKFKPTDVMVMTMPKSGTTWMQEILWTMLNNPNLDHAQANTQILIRSPQIDLDMVFDCKADIGHRGEKSPFTQEFLKMCPGRKPEEGVFAQMPDFLPDPRVIKSHLPFALFPPDLLDTTKVVYVARNPKDVIVSMCHHFRLMKIHNYTGTFEDFVRAFMRDDLLYCPYWPHVKMAWEKRNHPNLHFVFYEEMKADVHSEMRKLNEFLGTGLSQEQLNKIVEYTSFASMKKRDEEQRVAEAAEYMNIEVEKEGGSFFRKGQSGDWRNNFSPELLKEMNEWVESNSSKIGIKFM